MLNKMNWLEILKREVAASSQAAVAVRLGYSVTTVNQVLHGKYLGKTDKVAVRVIHVLDTVECPYLNEVIYMANCSEYANSKAPSHNPTKMQHWKACQGCSMKVGHDA